MLKFVKTISQGKIQTNDLIAKRIVSSLFFHLITEQMVANKLIE